MKTRKFSKQLFLSKKTIANLKDNDMRSLKGGEPETTDCSKPGYICPPTENPPDDPT